MLHLHRSERTDALVAQLAVVLAVPPDDPFTPDVVAVPTRGVERWLAQRLSHHLGTGADGEGGVCAHVTFASPSRVVGAVLATVLDLDPSDDPWHADRLVWPVLETLDACAGEAWCSALGRHLGSGGDDPVRRGRRLAVARRLAGLFTSYGVQRPEMVRAWASGEDDDGTGGRVPADLAWQPELWRRVRALVAEPSPAERLEGAVRRLLDDPASVDLPARLSVFGPTRLPEDQLRVLHALAGHRDVHLWLPHPSPALWRKAGEATPGSVRRRDRRAAAAHPLLASMARDATELQLRLTALEGTRQTHHPAAEPPPSLLGELQRRLRQDDGTSAPAAVGRDDRTVQVHACHGRARQVEVLREVLVGLFADDPTLEPRDVLVMCPDIENVAPLVAATFGLADGEGEQAHPGQRLRVRLADRSLRRTNPLLELLSRLLELADGRVTASEVLDLAAGAPVRRRFHLTDDDLDRVREWAVDAGVRWGEHAGRRSRFSLGHIGQGTWDFALDRILLGAAMADEGERFIGPALPLDDVDSTDVDLAGRLAELLDRLTVVLESLDGTRELAGWLDALDRALDLLADVEPADGWQVVQARAVLADVRTAGAAHGDVPLRLSDVRALLAGRLEGRPTRAGFRTGALTMCSLEPMRAVPHRVVCLLGLDDGTFPRGASADGDDVLLREPCLGERDRRSEDRQLFLDAVTSAQEHLVVLYSGADERTGARRPPAVPVTELLDALERAATTADGGPVRDQVVVHHPLQGVDERNFTAGALRRAGPFSFDAAAFRAALAGRSERLGRQPFLRKPLVPPERQDVVDVEELVGALEHPVKTFLRQRLGVTLAADTEDVDDRLPLQLDRLQQWAVGNRLLSACLGGVDSGTAVAAEWRRGRVPPRELGRAVLQEVEGQVVPIAAAVQEWWSATPATSVDVTADLPDGRAVTGTVAGVRGDVLVRAVYSRLAAKHRLRAWVQLLALAAAEPERSWRAVTVGRAQGSRPRAAASLLAAPPPAVAAQRLADLVALRDRALREPLPMPVDTACAYATSRAAGDEVVQADMDAERTWTRFEWEDEHHVLVWGDKAPFDVLLAAPGRTEQAWWPDDPHRLGVLARRVWDPLLSHERSRTL
ncbi:MAG: exodeoxyribonuclease V subunit gamma [Actinomycetes bacterium]